MICTGSCRLGLWAVLSFRNYLFPNDNRSSGKKGASRATKEEHEREYRVGDECCSPSPPGPILKSPRTSPRKAERRWRRKGLIKSIIIPETSLIIQYWRREIEFCFRTHTVLGMTYHLFFSFLIQVQQGVGVYFPTVVARQALSGLHSCNCCNLSAVRTTPCPNPALDGLWLMIS